MRFLTFHIGKLFSLALGFFLALSPFTWAQASGADFLADGVLVAQRASVSAREMEVLDQSFQQEQFSLQFYSVLVQSAEPAVKPLFQKVSDENAMHVQELRVFYTQRQLRLPAVNSSDPRFPPQPSLDDALRSGIQLESQEMDVLTGSIQIVTDPEMKNILGYLRMESYLHLCEFFVFSEGNRIPVAMDASQAQSCRDITALQKIEQEPSVPQRRSFLSGTLVSAVTDSSLLAQSNYRDDRNFGSFYQGYGYRYIRPVPTYYYPYPNYNNQQGYFPRDRYQGSMPNDSYFDFNFYFHRGYDPQQNYYQGGYPGGGSPYGRGR